MATVSVDLGSIDSHVYFVVFVFKQKTAYEMRISDWSSDVCSSDLALTRAHDLTLPRLLDDEPDVHATSLAALIRTVTSPYVDGGNDETSRVVVDGPDIAIKGSAIASIALLIHEFATNAAKYGALSAPGGRIVDRKSTSLNSSHKCA